MHVFLIHARIAAVAICLLGAGQARAAATAAAPQVLLAITNSESMDGTSSGAIMVGSGSLGAAYSSLAASSSPVSYAIPAGFTPPLNAGGGGLAPYTAGCGGDLCDNGPSRMNLAKAAIKQVLTSYGNSLNFGLYTYNTSNVSAYTTWVYYMSGAGGFSFGNAASASTVANPCYGYNSGSATVKTNCGTLAGLYGAATLNGSRYMTVAASSDDPQINDVLYASGLAVADFVSYGTVSPANPFAFYPLSTYNNSLGSYSVSYSSVSLSGGSWSTTPTNAGYVPYAPHVMYSMRGFGYGGAQSAATGAVAVAMGTDPATSSAFNSALAPETNDASTSEIKSVAGQSALGGLLTGAKTYLDSLTQASCQSQYVVLLTDGLPTLDLQGRAWPPLGTATANAYGLTATFNADGSFAASNSQAVTDAIAATRALATAGIKTYVIGLGAGVDASVNPIAAKLLQAMAIAGGTTGFFPATDPASLNAAFQTIANEIYTESAVAAPVAPISVSNGSSYEYALTTMPSPLAGHVKAYAVSATGTPAGAASWDAGALMTTALRTPALLAAKADNSIVPLGNVDAAAFALTVTACVPNVNTVVNYTINPSHVYSTCNYLAGREPGWFLGAFSTQNTGKYVGAPAAGLLTQRYATYKTYARSLAARAPMLMFTSNDGFLYAIDAASGALRWGWTTRNILSKLQNYSTFPASGAANGGFAVVDAQDGGGSWGSYVVGSMQSGAEHYSIKLDATGKPGNVVYDKLVAGGSSPGDNAVATGAGPARQPVLVAYVGSAAYALYVVNVGTTSTFYEVNVATGATTSSVLGFTASAALHLNPASNQLWFGGADGSIWAATVITGNAVADLALTQTQKIGNSVSPTSGAAVKPLLNVGYTEVDGAPYAWALAAGQLTVFGVTTRGWTPLWAATTVAGYKYIAVTSSWVATAGMATLTAGSVVSDQPITIGSSSLLVPVFAGGAACSAGTGYYDFFDLRSGGFPTSLPITSNGVAITGPLNIGPGPAFTPSITLTSDGISLNPGSAGSVKPPPPLPGSGKLSAAPFSWRQR